MGDWPWATIIAAAALALSLYNFGRAQMIDRRAELVVEWEHHSGTTTPDVFTIDNLGPATARDVTFRLLTLDATGALVDIARTHFMGDTKLRALPPRHQMRIPSARGLGERWSGAEVQWSDRRRRRQSVTVHFSAPRRVSPLPITVKVEQQPPPRAPFGRPR